MSLNTEHLTLPPMVKGKLNGHLTIKVDDLMWCRQSPGEVYVECQWWGMDTPIVFKPFDITQRDTRSQISLSSHLSKDYTFTFDIRTSLTMFENYLKNCGSLQFSVIKSKCHEKVGTVTVPHLNEIVKERMYQRYFPIINAFGNRIGDLHVGFSLWIRSKVDEEKENKLSSNDLFDKPSTRKEKRTKEKSLKMCKKHSNMLKNTEKRMLQSQTLPKPFLVNEPNKEKQSCVMSRKRGLNGSENHLLAPPNSVQSDVDLDSILWRGEQLRNAMFSSLYENDEVFRRHISSELTSIDPLSQEPFQPQCKTSSETDKKAILMNYLSGANITSRDEKVAMETLRTVSPAESVLYDSLSDEGAGAVENKLVEKDIGGTEVQAEPSKKENKSESAEQHCKHSCSDSSNIETVTNTCGESQSESQDPSSEKISNQLDVYPCLQSAFASVNCCRITVDYLKLASTNVSKNDSSVSTKVHCKSGISRNSNQQPGAVYFVEYNFSDFKQPLNEQYHTPVRYSTKKQNGQVIFFGQSRIHYLKKPFSNEKLKSLLQKANWKILRRHLNQRVPSLLGTVHINDEFEVKLESNLSFPVKSNTGITVGELFINLELGKDKAVFGNLLLGERLLAFSGKSEQACAEIQTEACGLGEATESYESINDWTTSTSRNSRLPIGDNHLKLRESSYTGKCHQIVIELDKLANCSSLLKSVKDQACYIDYKFPEFDEKTKKVHFSNKFFTTDVANCSPEVRFFYRRSHMINVTSLSQSLLAAAIPGITFSLWTRKFHPGIHDHLVATAFLPTATLCSLEHKFDIETEKSTLQETLILALNATPVISQSDNGAVHSKIHASGNVHLSLTYRQIGNHPPAPDQKMSSTNTTLSSSSSSVKDCTGLKQISQNDNGHFKDGCEKENCVCQNYYRLFNNEKNCSSVCPPTGSEFLNMVNKNLMKQNSINKNDDRNVSDTEKRIIHSVRNPALCSILNSQLSEKCQQKFVNFILQGNTKLRIVSKIDELMDGISNNDDLSGLKSTAFESLLTDSSFRHVNNNTTVQHVQVSSENVNKIDEIYLPLQFTKLQKDQEFSVDESHADVVDHLSLEQNQNVVESSKILRKENDTLSVQSPDTTKPEEIMTVVDLTESEEKLRENANDASVLNVFEVISPPAGFQNETSNSSSTETEESQLSGRFNSYPEISPFNSHQINAVPLVSAESSQNHHQKAESSQMSTGCLINGDNQLKSNQFYFKPLNQERSILSTVSEMAVGKDRNEISTQNNFIFKPSSRKLEKNPELDSDRFNRNSSYLSEFVYLEAQESQNRVQQQLKTYTFSSQSESRPEPSQEFEIHSEDQEAKTRSDENLNLESNKSEINYQEHDVDDLMLESENEKRIGNYYVKNKLLDCIKVSPALKNIVENLNLSNRDDHEIYENLLFDLKSYIDDVAKEIKNQLEMMEVKLHDRNMDAINVKCDSSASRKEEYKENGNSAIGEISQGSAGTIHSQSESYEREIESDSLLSETCSKRDKREYNQSDSDLPLGIKICHRDFTDYESINKKRPNSRDSLNSSDCFLGSTNSAFSKYKFSAHHKRRTMFKAKVEVERGYHLPKVTRPFSQSDLANNPNTFIKLQTTCQSLDDDLVSNIIENSCDPVWMASFDVEIPTELLKQVNVVPIDDISKASMCVSKDNSKKTSSGKSSTYTNEKHFVEEPCPERNSAKSVDKSNEIVENIVHTESKRHERDRNDDHCSSFQLTSSLKLKLSELDFLIDALKTKLSKPGTNPDLETFETAHIGRSASNNEGFYTEGNEDLDCIGNKRLVEIPRKSISGLRSNENTDSTCTRRKCMEQVSGINISKRYQNEGLFDRGPEDESPFRTYSIHSNDDLSEKTDLTSDNSDLESEFV